MNEFTFDSKVRRYRYASGSRSGQFVSNKAIIELVEKYMVQQRLNVATLTDDLLSDRITVDAWQSGVASNLKSLHINAYSLGRGGIGRLDSSDTASLESRLESEFAYLDKFAEDIEGGNLSDANIRNRATLYPDASYSQWQLGRQAAAVDSGEEFEIWDSPDDSASCADCLAKSQLGWQPVGTLGVPGASVKCLSRCRCTKRFGRDRSGGEVGIIIGSRDGWTL